MMKGLDEAQRLALWRVGSDEAEVEDDEREEKRKKEEEGLVGSFLRLLAMRTS